MTAGLRCFTSSVDKPLVTGYSLYMSREQQEAEALEAFIYELKAAGIEPTERMIAAFRNALCCIEV